MKTQERKDSIRKTQLAESARIKVLILLTFLLAIVFCVQANTLMAAPAAATQLGIDPVEHIIYANGNSIDVTSNVIYDEQGSPVKYVNVDNGSPESTPTGSLSAYSVFGGSKAGPLTASVKLTVTDSQLAALYGGNQLGGFTGDIAIDIKGNSSITDSVYGGGKQGDVYGNTSVKATGISTSISLYGGGEAGKVFGTTQASATDCSKLLELYGGGRFGGVYKHHGMGGNTTATMDACTYTGSGDQVIAGGCFASNVEGTAHLVIDKTTVGSKVLSNAVYAGTYDGSRGAKVGEANATIHGDALGGQPVSSDSFFTGGKNASVDAQPSNPMAYTPAQDSPFDAQTTTQLKAQTGNPFIDIVNGNVPLGGLFINGVWALVNLILCIIGVLVGLVAIIARSRRRQDEENDEDEQSYANGRSGKTILYRDDTNVYRVASYGSYNNLEQEEKQSNKRLRRTIWLVSSILAAIIGVVIFLVTEDMSLPMVLVDRWTIVNAIVLIIGIIASRASYRKIKNEDEVEDVEIAIHPMTVSSAQQ